MIELPIGTFLMYPSSLFIHFNVSPKGKVLQSNSSPFSKQCHHSDLKILAVPIGQNPDPQEQESWDSNERGSIVWFTQASMITYAELGTHTVAEAQKQRPPPPMPSFSNITKDGFYPGVV